MRPRHPIAVLVLLLSVAVAGTGTAQDPAYDALGLRPPLGLDSPKLDEPPAETPLEGDELDRRTEEITSLIRCPVCQGLSVADSPTDLALAMKAEARQLIAAGYSEDQILSYFERSYGEFIRLSPRAEGFNLLVWLAPILAVLVGVWLVATRVRTPRSATEETSVESDPELEPYLEIVRREVGS